MFWLNKKKIGIIGYGNMGSAIAMRIKKKYSVIVFDKDHNKTKSLSGIEVVENPINLINKVDAVILAVKPQDFLGLLNAILDKAKNSVRKKLIISIAAGITTKFIETGLGRVRVIRAMPNLPAKVGMGMICLCKGKYAKQRDLIFAKNLFKYLGSTLILRESQMDAATAISGSGPGYLYDWAEGKDIKEIKEYSTTFARSLAAAAESIGFSQDQAKFLAANTTAGSIAYLEMTNLLPQEAKKQVVSKGGTTEAALEVLHKGGDLREAVRAALRRAKELLEKEK